MKEEVEKTVEEHVNLESVPSDQGGEIEILSNVVNSEVEEIVNKHRAGKFQRVTARCIEKTFLDSDCQWS